MAETTNLPANGLPRPLLTIERRVGWIPLDMAEIWRFRDLLLTLAGRDIRLRYRQTALGVAWVVLQPLVAAGLFSFVFGILGGLGEKNQPPYFLLSYTGMLVFNVFNSTLTKSGTCLVGNAHLVAKVYFPRMILPLSTAISSLLDFFVGFAVLVVMIAYCEIHLGASAHLRIGAGLLLIPLWLTIILTLALGAGLFASALTVRYRDVQYILPVLLQFALYASPVGYVVARVTTKAPGLLPVYLLNPLASVIEAFRWSCLGFGTVYWPYVGYALVFSIVLWTAGGLAFKRMERQFADVI